MPRAATIPPVINDPVTLSGSLFPDPPTTAQQNRPKITECIDPIVDEAMLAAVSAALGETAMCGLSDAEATLLECAPDVSADVLATIKDEIRKGGDPLGEAFCKLRPAARRREDGAVYTPPVIVGSMLSWAEGVGIPDRVIDPGAGSGRFLLEAGRRFPTSSLVAVERDPLAALTTRANLAVAGMANRSEVRVEDFLTSELRGSDGRTLFVGNPPYVRHHLIRRPGRIGSSRKPPPWGCRRAPWQVFMCISFWPLPAVPRQAITELLSPPPSGLM